jgi:peptidoglycan/LPS O-acetylase OafA/YrhL
MKKIINKSYSIFVLVAIISLLFIGLKNLYEINQAEVTIQDYESLNQNCTLEVDDFKNLENIKNLNFVQIEKNISITSNPKNIFCLNKVTDFKISSEEIIFYVGKSKKFTDFIEKYFFLSIVAVTLYLRPKKSFSLYLLSSVLIVLVQDFLGISDDLYTLLTKLAILLAIFASKQFTNFNISNLNIKKTLFRPDINILRAIAVISVIFYHAGFTLFKGGWLGVDLFFVISGFLISNSIMSKSNTNDFKFRDFYVKRLNRIFPAYYFMLLFSIPFSYLLLTPKSMVEFLNNLKYSVFFVSNIYLSNLDLYISDPSKYNPLLHTWSLSVEEQFYIVFPVFIFYYLKNKNANFITLVNILILSLAINLYAINNQSTFYYFQFRLWEFFVGILLMIYLNHTKNKVKFNLEIPGLTLLLIPILIFGDKYILDLFPKIISLFGIGLLIFNSNKNYMLHRVSRIKVISFIGLSSYSIYLYHQPIYAFVRNYLRQSFEIINFKTHVLLLIGIVTLSGLSYVFIEKPYQNNVTRYKYAGLGLAFLTVSVYFIFGLRENGYENRFENIPQKVINYSINTNLYPGDGSLDDWDRYSCEEYIIPSYGSINDNQEIGPCKYIKDKAESNIFLIGDSHANTLSVEIIRNGNLITNKFNFIPINGTTGRCILSAQNDFLGDRYDCSDLFFNDFLNTVNKEDIIMIVGRFPLWLDDIGINQIQCSNDCFPDEVFKERLVRLANSSKKLIIIYPIPTHPFNVTSTYFYGQYDWGEAIYSNHSEWKDINRKSTKFLDNIKLANIERTYPEEIFCDSYIKDQCVAAINDDLFYTDDNHLTLEGNNLIIQELLPLIND